MYPNHLRALIIYWNYVFLLVIVTIIIDNWLWVVVTEDDQIRFSSFFTRVTSIGYFLKYTPTSFYALFLHLNTLHILYILFAGLGWIVYCLKPKITKMGTLFFLLACGSHAQNIFFLMSPLPISIHSFCDKTLCIGFSLCSESLGGHEPSWTERP